MEEGVGGGGRKGVWKREEGADGGGRIVWVEGSGINPMILMLTYNCLKKRKVYLTFP